MKDSDFQMNVANGSGGPAVYVNGVLLLLLTVFRRNPDHYFP